MQETLFGSRTNVQELKREEEKSGSQHGGLSFDDFVDKVVDLRWDTPAGALDLEMLKSMVKADDKMLVKRLAIREENLRQLSQGNTVTAKDNSEQQHFAKPHVQQEQEVDWSVSPLADVPTELLFHVLKTRELQDMSGGKGA